MKKTINSVNKDVNQEALDKLNEMNRKWMMSMGLDVSQFKNKEDTEEEENIEEEEEEEEDIEDNGIEEEEFDSEEEIEQPRKKVEVVIYQDLSKEIPKSMGSKKFLSSNIKQLDKKKKVVEVITKVEKKEEEENQLFDKELESLLKDSNLIEKLATSELTGKAKRKHQLKKLVQLGAKPMKKSHDPIKTRLEVIRNKKRKVDAKIERAKEEGNFDKKFIHEYEDDSLKKKKKKKVDGLKTSLGKFKDGVLHISKNHIKRNTIKVKKDNKKKSSFRK